MSPQSAKSKFRPKYLLAGFGIALAVLVGLGVYLFWRIEPSDYLGLLNARVKALTGRELTIAGEVGFSISMVPTISAEDVRFQNAPWGSRPEMFHARRIEVVVALLPLLRGEVEIRALELIEPDLLLETSPAGEPNWRFTSEREEAKPSTEGNGGRPIGIHRVRIANGLLAYRDGATGNARHVVLDLLTASRTASHVDIAATGSMNSVPLELAAQVPHEGGGQTLQATIKASGATLSAKGTMPQSRDAPLDLEFSAEVNEWTPVAKLAQTKAIQLPSLKAAGRLRADDKGYVFDPITLGLGRSDARGSIRVDADAPHAIAADIDSSLLDLAEILGPSTTLPPADGRLFSAEPFALAPLKAFNGKLAARFARVVLRDGKPLDAIDVTAALDRGRLKAEPLRLRVAGRELRLRIDADGSSGTQLGVDVAIDGTGIPLGTLASLAGIAGNVEGAPTDVAIRFASRGRSVRALMAEANADVRIVIGPGRIRSKTLDLGGDITELLDVLNPARKTDPYTELRCAVIRLPVRRGVAQVDNGIAMETAKVHLIAAGVIDLRNETLDLGFRPRAVTGIGVGLGGLASLARLRGSLTQPQVEADFGGAASAATQLGLAAITGGLSLLAGGMLTDKVPEQPCQAALAGNVRAQTKSPESKPSVLDEVWGGIKRIFER